MCNTDSHIFFTLQKYITYYIFWSKFLLVEMIPYVTIIVLNSMILGKIWKSTQFRKRFVVSERSALGTLGGTEPRWKLVSRVARARASDRANWPRN